MFKLRATGKWRVERDGETCNDIDNSHLLSEKGEKGDGIADFI